MNILFALLALLVTATAAPYDAANPPIRPDPTLTPGLTREGDMIEALQNQSVKSEGIRNVPESMKKAVFIAYFGTVPANPGDYEIDHLVSLELGGANDTKNLWPQSYKTQPWNSHVKDRLEDWMAASVRHTLKTQGHDAAASLLTQYQREISTDWIAAYSKYLGKP